MSRPDACHLAKNELPYKLGYLKPRHVGFATIYSDKIRKMWRVKKGRGRRDEVKVEFANDAKGQWRHVVSSAADILCGKIK